MGGCSYSRHTMFTSIYLLHLTFFFVPHIGAHPPVDVLPFLKFLPNSLASWKTLCENTRRMQRKIYFGLLRETEERMSQGHENGCFIEQVCTSLTPSFASHHVTKSGSKNP